MKRLIAILLMSIAVAAQSRDAVPTSATPARGTAATPRANTALIEGQVVAASATGTPVRLAIVTLSGAALDAPRTVVTDETGAFRFADLPNGRYTLAARRVTYLESAYGAAAPGEPGSPIVVAPNQQMTGLRLILTPGGIVTGTIRDQTGGGIPDVTVLAVPLGARVGGELTVRAGTPTSGLTDDRGVYRLFGLPPGDYAVLAAPPIGANGGVQWPNDTQVDEILRQLERRGQPGTAPQQAGDLNAKLGPTSGYAPIFYPGTSLASDAGVVQITSGQERGGIDITMAPVRTISVSGTIVAAGGTRPPVQLLLQTLGPQVTLPMMVNLSGTQPQLDSSQIARDGTFKYTNVPPGRYRIGVRTTVPVSGPPVAQAAQRLGAAPPSGEGQSILWGLADFTANGDDISGVIITLQPALAITGRIDASRLATPPDLSTVRFMLGTGTSSSAINGTSFGTIQVPPATIHPDGSFEFRNVVPGTYRFNAQALPAGMSVRSATINDRDLVDLPLEVGPSDVNGLVVTLSDRKAGLSGTLQTTAAAGASQYVVVAFPADRALWLHGSRWVRLARPGTDGVFTIDNLPAGDYLVALLTGASSADLERPEFLEEAARGALTVSIAEGEQKRQDLKIGAP